MRVDDLDLLVPLRRGGDGLSDLFDIGVVHIRIKPNP
jgi:hypothetical protein